MCSSDLKTISLQESLKMISLLLSSSILFVGTQGVEVDGCSLMVSAKENLVAQHLAGNWTYHTKLTTHIYHLDSEKEVEPLNQIVLHIQDDSSVLKFVPEKDCSELMTSNTEIFMAGYFNRVRLRLGHTHRYRIGDRCLESLANSRSCQSCSDV